MFDLIQRSFQVLPLCTIIEKKVLVLHGGLFSKQEVVLQDILEYNHTLSFLLLTLLLRIDRKRDVPGSLKKDEKLKLMEEILWSDPSKTSGIKKSSRGIIFSLVLLRDGRTITNPDSRRCWNSFWTGHHRGFPESKWIRINYSISRVERRRILRGSQQEVLDCIFCF